MEDRLYRGFIAGGIGGIATSIAAVIFGALGFTTLRLMEWAAILVFGHIPPFSTAEFIIGTLVHIGFSAVIGAVFAYFVLKVTERKILFKGWLSGVTVWFTAYIVTSLFRVEGTMPLPVNTVISNLIVSSLYGVIMGYSFRALDPKQAVKENTFSVLAQPAAKPGRPEERKRRRKEEDQR